jgi:hypothetical protein
VACYPIGLQWQKCNNASQLRYKSVTPCSSATPNKAKRTYHLIDRPAGGKQHHYAVVDIMQHARGPCDVSSIGTVLPPNVVMDDFFIVFEHELMWFIIGHIIFIGSGWYLQDTRIPVGLNGHGQVSVSVGKTRNLERVRVRHIKKSKCPYPCP